MGKRKQGVGDGEVRQPSWEYLQRCFACGCRCDTLVDLGGHRSGILSSQKLCMHLFNLCQKKPQKTGTPHVWAHRRVRTRVLLTTSPVSGSLIKLTDAGPSGQAEMSGPSRSCHDMMDLSSAGCQAATQVHCPVGVHQKTLGKHPVDLICI